MATWKPDTSDYIRIFQEQNPWHSEEGVVPSALAPPVERPLAQSLHSRLLSEQPRRFQVVLGPRRVGKTVAMYQTVRKLVSSGVHPRRLWWMRLDHPLLMEIPLDELARLVLNITPATNASPLYLFLDELVYAKDWDLWLKTFYDEHRPLRIVATSSASASLRNRRLESGVGRWDEQYLAPYLFPEYLDLVEQFVPLEVKETLSGTLMAAVAQPIDLTHVDVARRRFLLTGGFPELLINNSREGNEEKRLLDSQMLLRGEAVERAIYKDIPQEFGVDSPMMLERLLYLLAGQVTGVLSPTKLCKELNGVSQMTFERYLSYLERAFIVFTLLNYSGNEGSIQRRGRKLYFVDGAVRNAALQRGLAPLSNSEEMGLLLENSAAAHLHALAQQTQQRLFYWRDGSYEVDLILEHPDQPLAFEIGSSATHTRKGLQALMQRHPRFVGGCYLVSPNSPSITPREASDGVGMIPLDVFLIAVGSQTSDALRKRLDGVDM